jgi:hypothetical protein
LQAAKQEAFDKVKSAEKEILDKMHAANLRELDAKAETIAAKQESQAKLDAKQKENDELRVQLAAMKRQSRKRKRLDDHRAHNLVTVKIEGEERASKRLKAAEGKANEAQARAEAAEERGVCGICMEDDAQSDTCLLPCLHRMCSVCADDVLVLGQSCPSCRKPVTSKQLSAAV